MNILEKIRNGITYFDGGAGTLLQSWGLRAGELPESWNLTHPEKITEMHRMYLDAGPDIVTANTFGANILKFDNLEEIVTAAISNAKKQSAMKKNTLLLTSVLSAECLSLSATSPLRMR